ASHPDDLVSSALVRTEARRALLRNDPEALPELPAILSVIAQSPVSETVLDSAAMFPEPLLRSLDAIHLASAQSITVVTAVLAYDKHFLDAARNASAPDRSAGHLVGPCSGSRGSYDVAFRLMRRRAGLIS
nr:PIN domain-containing protein [Actinomycetota bacterium]